MGLQLNNYQIKLLAAILMVVDHMGAVFWPQLSILRLIGRLSFPLFAWLLAQGEQHTKNFSRYVFRLVLLGLISQPIYLLTLRTQNFNILFTLALGLVALRLSRLFPRVRYLPLGLGAIAAEMLRFSYGAYGVAMIWLMGKFTPSIGWWLAWSLLHLITLLVGKWGSVQLFAIVTPVILQAANYQRGPAAQWFYPFYPLHLLILYLVNVLLIQ